MSVTPYDVVDTARAWIGTPYHHQASVRGAGCDCVGLIRGVYAALVGPISLSGAALDYSRDWGDVSGNETVLDAARQHLIEVHPPSASRIGHVVVLRWRRRGIAKHAGILGPGTLIHAAEGHGVVECTLDPMTARRIVATFAFPGVAFAREACA